MQTLLWPRADNDHGLGHHPQRHQEGTLYDLQVPLNGIAPAFGFVAAGQPEDTTDFAGNTLRIFGDEAPLRLLTAVFTTLTDFNSWAPRLLFGFPFPLDEKADRHLVHCLAVQLSEPPEELGWEET